MERVMLQPIIITYKKDQAIARWGKEDQIKLNQNSTKGKRGERKREERNI